MRTSKLRFKWNFLNGLLFQPTVAWDVFKMDMRYLSLKGLQVSVCPGFPVLSTPHPLTEATVSTWRFHAGWLRQNESVVLGSSWA